MPEFISRTSAPSYDDKNYIHYSNGGYNYCIERANGSVLPNCVGYAWGRWREILGKKHKLSTANAENWYGNTSDGYERGQTPRIGAVICWRKGQAGNSSDGAGHVAIVEDVNADGSIVISNSDYSGRRFYTRTLSAPYKLGSAYTFQGFIYLPTKYDSSDLIFTDNDIDTNTSSGSSASSSSASSIGLEWWGDIVKVVLCILLIIIGTALLVMGVKDTVLNTITGG